ncbi:MAG: extracellular solute-binding protein [Acidimicrobiales bacterium]
MPLTGIDELIRSSFSIEGTLYPSATFISTPVLYYNRTHFLYYNRTHFEEAGLDPDSPPQTLAEVRDAGRAIKAAGVATTPLSFLMQGLFVDTWLTGADVALINADNGRAGNATEAIFNGPEALEIYELLKEMNDEGLILPFSNVPGEVGQFLALANPGTASMLFETSTASTTIAGVLGGTSNLSDLIADA